MKRVLKHEIELGFPTEFSLQGHILPVAEVTALGMAFWSEHNDEMEPVTHTLFVAATGFSELPDNYEWLATARHPQTGFVGHLYWIPQEEKEAL